MVTARLIRRILFGNFHSVMRSRLSTDSGYSYNIYSDPIYLPNFGLALIYTHCRPNNLKGLVETLLTTLQEFKTLGPSEEELELAKKTHIKRSLIDDDHPNKLRERLRDELMYYKPVTIQEYSNIVNQITRETVIEFLKKYWDFSKTLLFIRGPFDQMKFLSDINEGNLMQLLNNLN